MSVTHLRDRLLPWGTVAVLAAFFFLGLLWPLSTSWIDAVRDRPVMRALAPGQTLAQLAAAETITETQLRAWNDLPTGEPAADAELIVKPARWTGEHLLGLFDPDAPQWRWVLNSLWLAVLVTAICAAISYPLAYLQVRTRFPGQMLLGGMLLLPLVLPPFVGAIGLRRLLARYGSFNLIGMELGLVDPADPIDFLGEHRLFGMVLVMVLHFYPLLYLNLAASISNVDPSLIESARNLGASPWRIFRRVVFPLSVPGLVAGGSLVFVGAFTDLGTPLVFSYQEVVAKQIFDLANEQTANPAAPALVAVVTVIVVALFALTRMVVAKSEGSTGVKGASRGGEKVLKGGAAWGALGLHVFVAALALLPHLAVVLAGTAGNWSMSILPEEWTGRFVTEAMSHPVAQVGIRNSLMYAAGSTFIDVILGLACAWVIVRRGGIWGRVLDGLTLAPLAIPGIVLAFGYVAVYSNEYMRSGTVLTVGWFLVLSYAVRRLPYTTRACAAGLEQLPRNIEEAGGGLGAAPGRVLATITVPLIMANVAAGAILAFAFAMLEVSDSLILANRPQDFPLTKAIYYLFGRVGDGDQLASGLGLFALVFMALSLLAAGAFLGRKWGEMFRG